MVLMVRSIRENTQPRVPRGGSEEIRDVAINPESLSSVGGKDQGRGARCLEKTSAKSWYSLGTNDRSGGSRVGADLWEWQCMLHPNSEAIDQSSLGLWRPKQLVLSLKKSGRSGWPPRDRLKWPGWVEACGESPRRWVLHSGCGWFWAQPTLRPVCETAWPGSRRGNNHWRWSPLEAAGEGSGGPKVLYPEESYMKQ